MERVLLIDLDNCPHQIEALSDQVQEFSRILACYGGVEPKIPLRLLPILAEPVMDGKLEILGMEKKGKNAADFGLAFLAGRLMAEMPVETEFCIVSQDTDLDHVVNLLKQFKRSAIRWNGTMKAQIESGGPKQDTSTRVKKIAEDYINNHLPKQQRPRKKTTLLNSIRTFLKKDKSISADAVYRRLLDAGYISLLEGGKIKYSGQLNPKTTVEMPF